MKIRNYFLLALVITIGFTSCKDDKETGSSKVNLAFTTVFGTEAYDTASYYHAGEPETHIKFETVNYYISNVRLVDHDGNETSFDKYFLVKSGQSNNFELGEVDADHYHYIRFDVGVDSATNHGTDPATQPSGSALAVQSDKSMFWSWNSGYIFMRIDGMIDTTDNHPPTFTNSVQYHIGGDASIRPISLDIDLEMDGENDRTLTLKLDMEKVLQGLDLKATQMVHMPGSTAYSIADKWQAAFSAE
ncbi:MAG: MbnP family protein [Chitinophagales bacterium]|nr:MbnP family protein [Chitinophagales bacterium]